MWQFSSRRSPFGRAPFGIFLFAGLGTLLVEHEIFNLYFFLASERIQLVAYMFCYEGGASHVWMLHDTT